MNKSFNWYKYNNDIRVFMNTNVWQRLERHGFPSLANSVMHRKTYGHRIIHENQWTNAKISEMIRNEKPCMISRFGNMEITFLSSYMNHKRKESVKNQKNLEKAMNNLCLNAGFFPNDLSLGDQFVDLYLESAKELDLCGVWDLYMEDYVLDEYAPDCQLARLRWLEPWNAKDVRPWSSALSQKRVLVIHPFEETIKKQYIKHKEIFSNKFNYEDILPDFELRTIKAVQSIGGEHDQFANWFDAFNSMVEKTKQIDFDVAIIGCGAYGMPLAAAIKKMGKKAIHLGGSTQLMFGIWGHRWDQIPGASELLNDAWVRPSDDEKPSRANEVEDGCYW